MAAWRPRGKVVRHTLEGRHGGLSVGGGIGALGGGGAGPARGLRLRLRLALTAGSLRRDHSSSAHWQTRIACGRLGRGAVEGPHSDGVVFRGVLVVGCHGGRGQGLAPRQGRPVTLLQHGALGHAALAWTLGIVALERPLLRRRPRG